MLKQGLSSVLILMLVAFVGVKPSFAKPLRLYPLNVYIGQITLDPMSSVSSVVDLRLPSEESQDSLLHPQITILEDDSGRSESDCKPYLVPQFACADKSGFGFAGRQAVIFGAPIHVAGAFLRLLDLNDCRQRRRFTVLSQTTKYSKGLGYRARNVYVHRSESLRLGDQKRLARSEPPVASFRVSILSSVEPSLKLNGDEQVCRPEIRLGHEVHGLGGLGGLNVAFGGSFRIMGDSLIFRMKESCGKPADLGLCYIVEK